MFRHTNSRKRPNIKEAKQDGKTHGVTQHSETRPAAQEGSHKNFFYIFSKSGKKKKKAPQHGKTHGVKHDVTPHSTTHPAAQEVSHKHVFSMSRGAFPITSEQLAMHPYSSAMHSAKLNQVQPSRHLSTTFADRKAQQHGVTHGVTQHRATRPVTHGIPQEVSHRPFYASYTSMLEDTQIYREGYPGKPDDLSKEKNWLFYSNSIPYEPNGILIDELHRRWADDYDTLERKHDYIQWLFPIRESGMNGRAQELQLHEAKKIKENKKAKDRVLKSYRMMLGFYGIKSDNEGKLLKHAYNWEERAYHLNRSRHNHLRITRILKSLGELGFENLKKPFIDFILIEVLKTKTLSNTFESCKNYWIQVLKNDQERNQCLSFFEKFPQNQEKGSKKKSKRTTYV